MSDEPRERPEEGAESEQPEEAPEVKEPEAAEPVVEQPQTEEPGDVEQESEEPQAEATEATEQSEDEVTPSEESTEDQAAAAEREAAEKAAALAKAEAAAKAKAAKAAAEAAKPPWLRDPAVPEWLDAEGDPLVEALRASHRDAVKSASTFAGELTLDVRADAIRELCASLRSDHGFDLLVDICGVDYPDREPRFDVVYHLYSLAANRRIRLKLATDEETPVPTVCEVWKAANWSEREVYDMYGVKFADHPDMSRILLWEGFNGYPLRKDFPVEGIDTGSAIYPEYYLDESGPVAGTGTGWKPPEAEEEPAEEAAQESGSGES